MTYSSAAKTNLLALSADEPLLEMLEITHVDLAVPIRVVSDVVDLTSLGRLFKACLFDVSLPSDSQSGNSLAQLAIDNVGQELTQWLEVSHGGIGAQCRLMQVFRSSPDVIELDITMDLTGLNINQTKVTGQLGYVNMLNQQAITVTYRPDTALGIF